MRHELEQKKMKSFGQEVSLSELPLDLQVFSLQKQVRELLDRVEELEHKVCGLDLRTIGMQRIGAF